MNKLQIVKLLMVIVIVALLPIHAISQKNDGFFKSYDNDLTNRDGGISWNGLVTQDPTTPEVPLGEGLLVMLTAGAGYLALRKRKALKKGTTMMLTLVLLLGMTQCKKNVETISTASNGVTMILEAYNGNAKTNIYPNGTLEWGTNEVIYVINDASGTCVGSVTNGSSGGTTFTGTVSVEPGTYNFHYYYVGTVQTIASGATSFEMDFTKQDGALTNLGKFHIGCGVQTGVEVSAGNTISAETSMTSMVSVAYFNTTGMADGNELVYLYGDKINNKLSIDFSNNTVTYSKINGGWICTGAVSSGAYVMLVPNDGTSTDITFASKRTTGTCNNMFTYGIHANRFYCSEGNTSNPIAVAVTPYPKGILRGQFIVNDSGNKKVRFSQGNLQYIGSASTPYWKFADNQYDWIGAKTPQNTTATNIDRDLFGWGTSGVTYDYGDGMTQAIAYQPYSTSTTNGDYYAYGSWAENLNDIFYGHNEADWGYNAILNGGNTTNLGWYTMTYGEWGYVTYKNTIGYGTVHGVRGVILLPFNWSTDYSDLYPNFTEYVYNVTTSWPNVFNDNTSPTWSQMEAAGCVFLPAAGYRDGTNILNTSNKTGYYWSDTYSSTSNSYGLIILDYRIYANPFYRYRGASVRLVR